MFYDIAYGLMSQIFREMSQLLIYHVVFLLLVLLLLALTQDIY